jgi:hypothetical protein
MAALTVGLVLGNPVLPPAHLGALVRAGARFCVPIEATLTCLPAPLRTSALHLACCLPVHKLEGVMLHCPAAEVSASARCWGTLPLAGPMAPSELYTPLGAALLSDTQSPLAAAWLLHAHP